MIWRGKCNIAGVPLSVNPIPLEYYHLNIQILFRNIGSFFDSYQIGDYTGRTTSILQALVIGEGTNINRHVGLNPHFLLSAMHMTKGRTVRIVNNGRGCGTTTPMRTSRDLYDMRDCTEITLHTVELGQRGLLYIMMQIKKTTFA